MNEPIIGVTTYGCNEKNQYYLPVEYVHAIRAAGGVPFLISPRVLHVDAALAALDGLVFSGGGDIHPFHYDGQDHIQLCDIDEDRDISEITLATLALRLHLPILAICRGAQLINIIQGGSLHSHLPDAYGDVVAHRDQDKNPITHPVTLSTDSSLAKIVGATQMNVTSWHHQAIDRLAEGFVGVAKADDGLLEAFEAPDYPQLIALQWHPELSAAHDPLSQNIFNGFIAHARDYSKKKSN